MGHVYSDLNVLIARIEPIISLGDDDDGFAAPITRTVDNIVENQAHMMLMLLEIVTRNDVMAATQAGIMINRWNRGKKVLDIIDPTVYSGLSIDFYYIKYC